MTLSHSTAPESTLRPGAARELMERHFAVMAAGDLDDFTPIVHPDAINRKAVAEPPSCRGRGPSAWYQTALWLRSMFSELSWDLHETVAEGDLVAVYTTMRGVHTGPYSKYDAAGKLAVRREPTGRRFASPQTHWYRVTGESVLEHWASRDDLGLATQLGFLGPPSVDPRAAD
jgi:predicted ester cyclase